MAGKKIPSYVFSAALQNQSSEEKEKRRQSLPAFIPPPTIKNTAGKLPPPVAPKPKSRSASSIAAPDMSKLPPSSGPASGPSVAPRKKTLPRQMTTGSMSETDGGGGQKMGGAFARLQRQLEGKEPSRDVYQEAYENYKIKRSLKEHGVLPSEHRTDENVRKFSVGRDVPPVVLPKPVRRPSWDPSAVSTTARKSSVETKREEFSRNRAMTSPASPTSSVSPPQVYTPTPWKQGLDDCFAPNVNVRKGSRSDSASSGTSEKAITETTEKTPKIDDYAVHGPTAETNKVDPVIEKNEESVDVDSMKKEYLVRKNSIQQGQKELADTINQLENLDIESVVSPKSPSTETSQFPELTQSAEPATESVTPLHTKNSEEISMVTATVDNEALEVASLAESVVSNDSGVSVSSTETSSEIYCDNVASQDTYFGADNSNADEVLNAVDTNVSENPSDDGTVSSAEYVVTVTKSETTEAANLEVSTPEAAADATDAPAAEKKPEGTNQEITQPALVEPEVLSLEDTQQAPMDTVDSKPEEPKLNEPAVVNPYETAPPETPVKSDTVTLNDSQTNSSVPVAKETKTPPKATPVPAPRVKKETTV